MLVSLVGPIGSSRTRSVPPTASPLAVFSSDRTDAARIDHATVSTAPAPVVPPASSPPSAPPAILAAPRLQRCEAPVTLLASAAPASPSASCAIVLRGAPLWASLAAAGWMHEQFADPPPERGLTPPEKAGVMSTFQAMREAGFTFIRDHGTPFVLDLRPLGDDELAALLDEPRKPSTWKMGYRHETTPDRCGAVHFLPRIAELAYFSGISDCPDGVSSPEAAVAVRHLLSQGWTIRESLRDGSVSHALHPEKAYTVIAGWDAAQNLKSGKSLALERPAGAPLHVHTAAGMALLSPTCRPGTASTFLAEHIDGPGAQAALDVASILAPEASLADARALFGAVTAHLQPLVDDGRLSARYFHPILRTVMAPADGPSMPSRLGLFTSLLEAFESVGAVVPGTDRNPALDVWPALVANARAPHASAEPSSRRLYDAAAQCPSGMPLERQVEVAARVLRAVSAHDRDEALYIALNEVARTRPDAVDDAVRLMKARVPLSRVVDGLVDADRLDALERLSAAAAQPRYEESLDDLRAARALPLGTLTLDARVDVLCRLLGVLASRGEASEARALYGRLSASVEEGRLPESALPATVDGLVQALRQGAGVQAALRQSQSGGARPDLVAAAAARVASAETAARIAALPLVDLPAFASSIVDQASTPEEALAVGTATLEVLSRTPGFEAGGRLALDAVAEMADAPLGARVAAIRDALPHTGATSADALVAVGDAVIAHAPFGLNARLALMRALKDDPEVGVAIRIGLEALGPSPKEYVSRDSAAAEIIDGRHATGADLAAVGRSVFHHVYDGMKTGDAERVAQAYMRTLRDDPAVGTSMWFADEVLQGLDRSGYERVYLAEAVLDHPAAATGSELATMCLAALDRVPEGSPRTAVRLAQPMLRALSRLYSDSPSRAAIYEAESAAATALRTTTILGRSQEGDIAAREASRQALQGLQRVDDTATRIHRGLSEGQGGSKVEQEGDYVVVAGVRVPRRA